MDAAGVFNGKRTIIIIFFFLKNNSIYGLNPLYRTVLITKQCYKKDKKQNVCIKRKRKKILIPTQR